MKCAIWQTYYSQLQKELALKIQTDNTPVEYGEIIYQSPVIQDIRWSVMSYKGEYNVFVDKIYYNGKFDRSLGASFSWKKKALDFALEMFLVCSGRLRRQDRYSFAALVNGVMHE